jgi:thiamine-monophosphate kinase
LIVASRHLPSTFVKHLIVPMVSKEKDYISAEQKLIGDIRTKIGTRFLGDDCARLPGNLIVTTDTMVEGSHFLFKTDKMSLEDLGWKAMAVNLSDIAAMGGHPRHALVSITLPDKLDRLRFGYLYDGLIHCSSNYQTAIVGGDITKGPVLIITITAIGETNENGCLLRDGARPGDVVIVTGNFGASKAGLKLLADDRQLSAIIVDTKLTKADIHYCLQRHNRPMPRLKESWQLVQETGSRGALMDASDGLADALAQICRASEVGMTIDVQKIPINSATTAIANVYGEDVLDWALYGGEDYELVACISETDWQALCLRETKGTVPLQKIGTVNALGTIALIGEGRQERALDLSKCYQHIA